MSDNVAYNDQPTLDEIVFQNRNKEYGAYDLRHNYKSTLTKSFLIGVGLFLVLALTPFIYLTIKRLNAPEKQEVKADLIDIIQEDKIIEKPEEKPAPPPPPPPKEEVKQEIVKDVVPEPKVQPKKEETVADEDDRKNKNTGAINQEGEKQKVEYTPPVVPAAPAGPAKPAAPAPAAPAVDNSIHKGGVDVEANFSAGGLDGFRSKVGSSFDTSAVSDAEGTQKTVVTFVVEKDGSISQVTAAGSNADFNREAIRTVKSIRTKWNPAKIGGQPVRSWFSLPVTINFE